MQSYSVTIFLGIDGKIRFVPGVKNKFGIYVPIPEGVENNFFNDAYMLGKAYCQAAQNALNHYGEDLNMKTAKPKYISFKGFKSQRDFDSKHHCISSFANDGQIEFIFLPNHNGEFALYNSDIECSKTVLQNNDYSVIGQAILDVCKLANKAYPKLNILSNSSNDDISVSLPTNAVTLFFKKANDKFFDKIKNLLKDYQVEEYNNGIGSISSFVLHCLVDSDNLSELNLLANECEELICIGSYSTVGFYGFFHYKKGKCLRGYSSLDESGEVLHNIGNISNAEKNLGLKFPQSSDEFAEDGFDEINHESLEKILSLIITKKKF